MLLTDYKNIKMGSSDISKIYQGDVQVWPKGDTPTGSTVAFTVSGTSTGSSVFYYIDDTRYKQQLSEGKFIIECDKTVTNFKLEDAITVGIMGDTSRLTDVSKMFESNQQLTTANLTAMNTSNVTSMSNMFHMCYKLSELDLSNFNTSNVKYMGSMFGFCKNITSLDLSNFDTSNVTSMIYMFDNCSKLTSLDLSNFDTSNVVYMYDMFRGSYNLVTLDLSNFNLSKVTKVTNMSDMFDGCTSLKTIKIKDEASANKLITQIKTDLSKTATWDSSTYTITIP